MSHDPAGEDRSPPPSGPAAPLGARALGVSFARGLAMGVADAIPGVSGGTIALILGFYDRLIGSLALLMRVLTHPRERLTWLGVREALSFLLPLGAGLVSSLFVATRLLVGKLPEAAPGQERALFEQLQREPPAGWLVRPDTAPLVFAFFFGLVLASVNEPWRVKRTTRAVDWPLAVVGALAAIGLSLSPPAAGSVAPLALVGAGAVAISVMLLPGVSGSLALLVLGMYQPVTGALHERNVPVVAWFLLGIVLGVITFVPLLRRLLAHAHDRTMSVLSGLMAGSLAALWPWKAHYLPKFIPVAGPMSLRWPDANWWGPVLSAVAGAAVIIGMARAARRLA